MKNIRFLTFVLTIATLLLSACGAAATPAAPAPITGGSSKVDAMPVAFVGVIDSITGDQWVISGTKVTVDQSIVRDGPFNVGDRIKVEGFVNPDGSLKVSRVETPAPQDAATQPPFVSDNSNDANANVNDDNSSAINSNDDNSNTANSNVNDDHGTDLNSNDDNSSSVNSNDASTNINDDHGTDVNSNDDKSSPANSNDDKGGSSNTNDDKGGGNSNDANANGNGG